MASVFLYHVVGDLTVGKPELAEFYETETIEAAIKAIGECSEGGIPVWKRRQQQKGGNVMEDCESRQQRFVGIIDSMDVVGFLSREECLRDQEKAMKTPVSEVVVPNNFLLKEVDPGTRLIDALEIMKHGVKRLLVPKSVGWKGMSRRFSIIYNGKWLKNINTATGTNTLATNSNRSYYLENRFCCLSREDVVRFLIGCLGALAPLPLSSISSLGVVNFHYDYIEASSPASEVTRRHPHDPSAVAVVDSSSEYEHKIIGEISASKLWKCDYMAAAWGIANLTAGQFVMGAEDNAAPMPDFPTSPLGENIEEESAAVRPRKFSSRSIGFRNNATSSTICTGRSMYRGRSAPLTCKVTSSLAAVMAQMLSHRATHVWVTEADNEEILVGVVGYADILAAVTRHPATLIPSTANLE